MFVMKTVDDLWEHIAYVMAYAPQFPYRDFLPADEQMTLDKAFEQLRQGVLIAYPEEEFASKRAVLNAILDKSYAAYRNKDDLNACRLLNDFEDGIFQRSN
ncbi:hypothetical protein [Sphingosinicella sp. BN140058]|uniref:hypothetical protein n=1 Tax=Sphingosinicella sp. BN140058 TaxID=1892855 RepID=UPI00101321C0|nr:hypothetical protein [Sphingosinicella sp. BN140058]QAY78163.1 hypothetical protein ETR14_17735 [Sphingosinicella sp. BN140058]